MINYAGILKEGINWYNDTAPDSRVIGWVSGGVASMVACVYALEKYSNVHLAFCDTKREHPDTYRFIDDFENNFGVSVSTYASDRFDSVESVWDKYKGLNFANGAPCSTVMKKEVRVKQVEKLETDYAQIFGFDYRKREIIRAKGMIKNHPETNPKFPLIQNKIDRDELFKIIKSYGIERPATYDHFDNNNCIGDPCSHVGGCVQGGIGYWQKIKLIYPKKYEYMAEIERRLSKEKGKPVTISKDQRKGRTTDKKYNRLFLEKNPDFPEIETIEGLKGKWPEGCGECNGFCGIDDQIDLF